MFAIVLAKLFGYINKMFDVIARSDVQRLLLTGLVVSLFMYAAPLTMFSGQHTLNTLYEHSISASFIALILIAAMKLLSTSLLIRAGFIGGAVFPTVFTGVALGLALNQFLDVSPAVAVAATTVGLLTILLRQPLSAAILVLLFFGFTSGAAVACGVAGALLILPLLPIVD